MRTLALTILATLATLLMTTNAFAQSTEVHEVETGEGHCSDVQEGANHTATGGCRIHVVSEDRMQTITHSGVSETVTTSCEMEFFARIDEDGNGFILTSDSTFHTSIPTGCLLTACDEPEPNHTEIEWPLSGLAETGNGESRLLVTLCFRAFNMNEGTGSTVCTVPLHVVSMSGHDQEFSANSPCLQNPAGELVAHWITEPIDQKLEDEIEIEHIEYAGV